MRVRRAALAAAMIAAAAPQVFTQGLPTQKMLSADIAVTLVHEAVLKCRADGYKVSAKVVDPSNIQKAFLRDDGASLVTLEVAQMKINSVLLTGRPSGPPPGAPAGAPPPPPIIPGTVNFEGAVPIKAGNDIVGVIGVSGAPGGDKDVACANAALAKVADRLK